MSLEMALLVNKYRGNLAANFIAKQIQNTFFPHFSNNLETHGIKFIFTVLHIQNIAQQIITKCQQ